MARSPKSGSPAPSTGPPPGSSGASRIGRVLLGFALGETLGKASAFIAGIIFAFSILFTTLAWQVGPQREIDRANAAKLVGKASGRIVDRWLAVEWDPAEVGQRSRWRPFAKATPCAVVEAAGDWGAPVKRAFCGNRLKFSESYTLHDLTEMAPGVPFDWARDAEGFPVPEIRMRRASIDWLAHHPPREPLPRTPAPRTALEALRLEEDRPVDLAVRGWSTPPAAFPLRFDPKSPSEAWPAAFVESRLRQQQGWWIFWVPGAIGIWAWIAGMGVLVGDRIRGWKQLVAVLPLVTIPWWGERFPRFIRGLNRPFAGVLADMMGDVDPLGRLVATEPGEAQLADGDRLTWTAATGAYADTFGKLRFEAPRNPYPTGDAALESLAAATSEQVAAMDGAARLALFTRLREDKEHDLRKAGLVFLPAASAATTDPAEDPEVRRAARLFLTAWDTQPIEEADERAPAYATRVRLFQAAKKTLP